MGQMTHYSVPTGKSWSLGPCELSPIVAESFLPTIADGKHGLPLGGYDIAVELHRHRAGWLCGAHATVLHGSRVAAAFTVALTEDEAEVLWRPFESFYLRTTDHGRPNRADWCSPRMPEAAPWVASFPLNCRPIEAALLPRLAGAWAITLSRVAVDEMNGCA